MTTPPPDLPAAAPPEGAPALVCYRHPDRPTRIRCTRCERPICTDDMRPASVGYQCPECVAEGARTSRRVQAPYGGRVTTGAPVTLALIAVNVVVFLLTLADTDTVYERFALRTGGDVALGGGLVRVPGVATGEWYRLLTSAFLHYGVLHIAFNMFALYSVGVQLERVLGSVRFAGVYLAGALGGSVATYLLQDPLTQTVGASGAIFGLFAAFFVVARRARVETGGIVATIVINLVLTFAVPQISKTGHVGGLLVGGAATALLLAVPRGPRRGPLQAAALVGLLALLVVVTAVRTAQLT